MDTNRLNYLFESKFFIKCAKHLKHLDTQVSKNLADSKIETRPVSSQGLWCQILIPSILLMNTMFENVTPCYKIITFLSVGLLCYCILSTLFLSITCFILKETIHGACIAASILSTLIIYVSGQDLIISAIVSFFTIYSYSFISQFTIVHHPKTFTVGEAMLVTQSIVLFSATLLVKLFMKLNVMSNEEFLINSVVYTALAVTIGIVTALNTLTKQERDIEMLTYIMSSAVIITVVLLLGFMGKTFFFQIFAFIFGPKSRIELLFLWALLVGIALYILTRKTQSGSKANTITRKSFHILASLVFTTGVLIDVNFLSLASGIAFALLILVEALRKLDIKPISSVLNAAFETYCDEKDCGSFAMTPIYLFAGMACPLVLLPTFENREMELLSGVLSIGVGDTAASIFGMKYGTTKWSGSNKTKEGTAFNVCSQLVMVYSMRIMGILKSRSIIRILIVATSVGLVEATTDQIDNLVLPLINLLVFRLTSFLG